ncbi:MAG: hypothetical protein ACXVCP_00440 [Bdellovibrio sp.]
MSLLLALAPAILQGLLMIISWFAKKSLNNQDKEEFFLHWKALCRVLNLKDLVEKRELAEQQLKNNSDAWDKIEEKEKNEKAP